MAIVRVLRVIEYVGEKEAVARQVAYSIHGTTCVNGKVQITAATIDSLDVIEESLKEARKVGCAKGPGDPRLLIEYVEEG